MEKKTIKLFERLDIEIFKFNMWSNFRELSQLTFTCSKSTRETLEKGVKYAPKLTIKTPERLTEVVFVINFKKLTPFSSISVANFEQLNVSWVFFLEKRKYCKNNESYLW